MGCLEKQRSQYIQTSAVGSDQSSLHVLCNLRHQIGVWKVKPCPLRSPLDNGKRNTNYLINYSIQRTNDIIWDLVNLWLLCWSIWEEGNGIRKGRPQAAADPISPRLHHVKNVYMLDVYSVWHVPACVPSPQRLVKCVRLNAACLIDSIWYFILFYSFSFRLFKFKLASHLFSKLKLYF